MEKRNVSGVPELKFMIVSKATNIVQVAVTNRAIAEEIFNNRFDNGAFELIELLDTLGYRQS